LDELLHGLVIGLHLVSAHVPEAKYTNNENPGVFVRTESGWTAGIYRNSLKRTSVYGGFTFTTDAVAILPLSLTVGVVSGYKKRRVETSCAALGISSVPFSDVCFHYEGNSRTNASLMLSPSVALPAAQQYIGVVPRLSYIPNIGTSRFSVFHLSVEKAF
jgi:hypothetical protein